MARGTSFLNLQGMLRDETGRASNVAVGPDDLAQLKTKLRRVQTMLYDEYDWPFLRQVFPAITLAAGVQYVNFPSGLNNLHLERVESVVVYYGTLPYPVDRGITEREYAIYNSLNGVSASPVMRWDSRWTGSADQVEIWPLPPDNTQTLVFTGKRDLRPLLADADVCDLDDEMIVLFAAAEILEKQGAANADTVKKAADARFTRMKGRVKGATRPRRLGMGNGPMDKRFPIVVHATQEV